MTMFFWGSVCTRLKKKSSETASWVISQGVIVYPNFYNGTWFVLHQIFVNPLEPGPGHLRFKKDLRVFFVVKSPGAISPCGQSHTFLEPAAKWSALGQALPWDPWGTMEESSGGRTPVVFSHPCLEEADDLSPPLLFRMITATITMLTGKFWWNHVKAIILDRV